MKGKAIIYIDNNRSKIDAPAVLVEEIRNKTKIRKPGAFFSKSYGRGGWDGYVRYITETGTFPTGFLSQLLDTLKEMRIKYTLEDKRKPFKHQWVMRDFENGDVLRPDQEKAVLAILENRIDGIRYQRGLVDGATNTGKSYIAAAIFGSYSEKRTGLLLIDNAEICPQLFEDLRKLLGKDNVGIISSKRTEIKRINVAMVQTLSLRMAKDRKLQNLVYNTDIVMVDECDTTANKKAGQKILGFACNAPVRVGLSGTSLKDKDKTKNQQILNYFGKPVFTITNKELVDLGISTKPKITILTGNKRELLNMDYADEYNKGITTNQHRHKRIWKRVQWHVENNHLPLLIMVRYREHIDSLLETCPEEIKKMLRIDWAHGDRKDRAEVIKKFKNGKLDILICSMIIQRGKNLPLTKALINASGGTSEKVVLQIFGRLLRKHESKEWVYMDDFFDQGPHLRRHSKRRIIYYKNQKFMVKEKYK